MQRLSGHPFFTGLAFAGITVLAAACQRGDAPPPGSDDPAPTAAGIPLNGGFERPGVEGFSRPWGWRPVSVAPGASFVVDSMVRREGRRSLRIDGPETAADPARATGAAGAGTEAGGDRPEQVIQLWVEPRFALGSRVDLSVWTRTRALSGRARLIVQTWGAGVLAGDTVEIEDSREGPGAEGSDEWRRVDLSVEVDSSAHSLVVMAGLAGSGSVWLDGLVVRAGGRVWDSVPVAEPPDPRTLDWLAARSRAIETVDASEPGRDDAADLEDFGRIVGQARIVGLGEATHGTSEFFRAKHRLLAYLVEHLGFRVFAIEANQLAVEPINEYVLGGPGEPRTLMRAMFAVWNTAEMRDLIEWMRAFNAAEPDRPVEFIGFDMQDPTLPIDSVSAWFGRMEPALRARVDSLYGSYREAWRETPYPQATDSVRESWLEGATEVFELVASRREEWLAGRSAAQGGPGADSAAVDRIVQSANLARQAALGALTGEFATRDSAMAENLRWALERRPAGTRAVVWAHDGHVSRAEHEYANYWGGGSMGGWLSAMYGDEYRVFGLLTYDGAYSGVSGSETIDARLLAAPTGTLEEALHRVSRRLGSPRLVTDLRDAPDPAGRWLLEPRPIRMLGYAAEDVGLATGISVGAQFDGIVFVDRTTPSRVFR